MLEGIDKAVIRGPLVVKPRPLWFGGNPKAVKVARRMIQQELAPTWGKMARVLGAVLF